MLPVVWALLRDVFPVLRNWGYKTNTGSQNTSTRLDDTHVTGVAKSRSRARGSFDMAYPTSSQEQLNLTSLEINKHTTVSVQEDYGFGSEDRQLGLQHTMVYSGMDRKTIHAEEATSSTSASSL